MRRILFFLLLTALCASKTPAQETKGRWSIGLNGGVNVWFNDLSKGTDLFDRKMGVSGDVAVRYGLARFLSAGILAGYQELKARSTAPAPSDYLKLHAIPASLVTWWHLAPGHTFSPYIYLGLGAMLYKRVGPGGVYVPDSRFRTTVHVPAGIGFEVFLSSHVTLGIDLGLRATDDYTDLIKRGTLDTYGVASAGLRFYLGSDDLADDDNDGLTNGEERTQGTDPRSADTDGDELSDGEEVHTYRTNPRVDDTDHDGLPDADEVTKHHTDPLRADSDDDGLADGEEVLRHRVDPLKADTDDDGLRDGDEVARYRTDPANQDSDGDQLSDGEEVLKYRTDPAKKDTDGDTLGDREEIERFRSDPLKADTDGGGVNDGVELHRETSPLDPKDDFGMKLERGKTVVLQGVNFQPGKAVLTPGSVQTLQQAYEALSANPDIRIEIAGYTDNTGSQKVNDNLSVRRAQAVRKWLVARGIATARLRTVGRGARDPIADNATVEGRARNRRIEFHVMP